MLYWGWLFTFLGITALGASNPLDFSHYPEGKLPQGFTALANVKDDASNWTIVETDAPDPLRPNKTVRRRVLARLGKDAAPDLYSVLLWNKKKFGELQARVSFKVVGGKGVQSAGMVFRAINGQNYYLTAVKPREGKQYFSIFEKGVWTPFSWPVSIPLDGWISLEIQWKGNEITLRMNEKNVPIKVKREIFSAGHVGFWARSDSTVYFTNAKASHPERVALSVITRLVRGNSRLIGLDILTLRPGKINPVIELSDNQKDMGTNGPTLLRESITAGKTFYKKNKNIATVTMPVKDPNGKPFAAARMFWETRKIPSKNYDLSNGTRMIRQIEQHLRSLRDLRN